MCRSDLQEGVKERERREVGGYDVLFAKEGSGFFFFFFFSARCWLLVKLGAGPVNNLKRCPS